MWTYIVQNELGEPKCPKKIANANCDFFNFRASNQRCVLPKIVVYVTYYINTTMLAYSFKWIP